MYEIIHMIKLLKNIIKKYMHAKLIKLSNTVLINWLRKVSVVWIS